MAASQVTDEAFVTLATNDSYALGAVTLGYSLKEVGTTRVLVCMITKGVSEKVREELGKLFELIEVNILDSQDKVNLALLTRPDLGVTFTKLHCWRLTKFTKCVFMDADTLVLQNIDDLFEREELSAAADVGWPDCFNSGVFVYKPSEATYAALLHLALSRGSYDGGDQGLLNSFFSDWSTKDIKRHLPFLYNVVAQAFYTYLPALKRFGKDAKVLHFIGAYKPWHASYNISKESVDCPGDLGLFCQDFLKQWWQIFTKNVSLSKEHVKETSLQVLPAFSHGGGGDDDDDRFEHGTSPSAAEVEHRKVQEHYRRMEWEKGHIDYLGIDKFENIQRQIDITSGRIRPIPELPGKTEEVEVKKEQSVTLLEREPVRRMSQPETEHPHVERTPLSADVSVELHKSEIKRVPLVISPDPADVAQYEKDRKNKWESGHMDYLGEDSFDNILKRLDSKTGKGPDADKATPAKSSLSSFPIAAPAYRSFVGQIDKTFKGIDVHRQPTVPTKIQTGDDIVSSVTSVESVPAGSESQHIKPGKYEFRTHSDALPSKLESPSKTSVPTESESLPQQRVLPGSFKIQTSVDATKQSLQSVELTERETMISSPSESIEASIVAATSAMSISKSPVASRPSDSKDVAEHGDFKRPGSFIVRSAEFTPRSDKTAAIQKQQLDEYARKILEDVVDVGPRSAKELDQKSVSRKIHPVGSFKMQTTVTQPSTPVRVTQPSTPVRVPQPSTPVRVPQPSTPVSVFKKTVSREEKDCTTPSRNVGEVKESMLEPEKTSILMKTDKSSVLSEDSSSYSREFFDSAAPFISRATERHSDIVVLPERKSHKVSDIEGAEALDIRSLKIKSESPEGIPVIKKDQLQAEASITQSTTTETSSVSISSSRPAATSLVSGVKSVSVVSKGRDKKK